MICEVCQEEMCDACRKQPKTHVVWNRVRDGMGFRTGLRQRLEVCLDCGEAIQKDAAREQ
jgi:hypothetical protein